MEGSWKPELNPAHRWYSGQMSIGQAGDSTVLRGHLIMLLAFVLVEASGLLS